MNDEQLLRYNRHIMLPQIDIDGQQRLLDAHVAIIGLGGLGSPAALYLAAAGVGALTLVDFDAVELSNLQRQIAHRESQAGTNKTVSARHNMLELNPGISIHCIEHELDLAALETLAKEVTLMIDATDNFATRYLINRACFNTGTPLVSGAAIQFSGQLSVFDFRDAQSPCYACLYGEDATEAEQTCSENGILAPVVGIIGCMMATETIKLICDIGELLSHRLMILDALNMQWREMRYHKDPQCRVCN
jgi:adenylyltransferase/sulfurtransferase